MRIVIADDHPIVREGLSLLLNAQRGFEVIGQAGDGVEATGLVLESRPDVLLLDVAMPRSSGMDVLRELSKADCACKTIILTASLERGQMIEALQLGARGVVLKGSPMELTYKSIRTVISGEYWIGREGVTHLVDCFKQRHAEPRPAGTKYNLTPRELQIVSAVIAGDTNRDVGQRLSISEDTVKHHLSSIFDKVGVSNRLELALFAIHHRLIPDDAPSRSEGSGV